MTLDMAQIGTSRTIGAGQAPRPDAPRGVSPCPCAWAYTGWHDALAGIEKMTVAAALEFAAQLALNESGAEDGIVYEDFRRFAAAHNWDEPALIGPAFESLGNLGGAWQEKAWAARQAAARRARSTR